MITFLPPWAIAVIIFLLSFLISWVRAMRDDRVKQRTKFAEMVRKADEELAPEGWVIDRADVSHGFMFGRGNAVWKNEAGQEAFLKAERL